MDSSCKTNVYVKDASGAITQHAVPNKFETKDGSILDQWVCGEDGQWRCALCPGKTKGGVYDPTNKKHRFDSKVGCHNRYQGHTSKVIELMAPLDGFTILPWTRLFKEYKRAVGLVDAGAEHAADGPGSAEDLAHTVLSSLSRAVRP